VQEIVVDGELGDSDPALAAPTNEPGPDALLVAGVVQVDLDVTVVSALRESHEPALLTLPILQPRLLQNIVQFTYI